MKQLILIIFFLLANSIGFAQSAKKLYKKGEIAMVKGEFKAAINYFENSVDRIYKNKRKIRKGKHIECLLKLSDAYAKVDRFKDAEETKLKIVEFIKSEIGEESERYANFLDVLSILYRETWRYQEALELIDKSLSILERVNMTNDVNYAIGLFNKGRLLVEAGLFVSADSLFELGIEIYKQNGEEKKGREAVKNSLITIYHHLNKDTNPLMELDRPAAYNEDSFSNTRYDKNPELDSLSTYSRLSFDYFHKKNYEQALRNCSRAIEIAIKYYGDESSVYARHLFNSSLPLYYLNQVDKAEEALEISQQILAKVFGNQAPILGHHYSVKSKCLNKKNKTSDAVSSHLKAIDIFSTSYGSQSYHTITNQVGLFKIYKNLANYEVAETYLKTALSNMDDRLSEYPYCLLELASLYINMHRFDEAEQILLQLIEFGDVKYALNDIEITILIRHQLADLYQKKGEHAKVNWYDNQTLEIFKKALVAGKSEGLNYHDQADLYIRVGRYEEAEKILLKGLEEAFENSGSKITYLMKLSIVYEKMGKLIKAYEVHALLTQIHKETKSESEIISISMDFHQAYLNEKLGNHAEVQELYLNIGRKLLLQNKGAFQRSSNHKKNVYLQKIQKSFNTYSLYSLKNSENSPELLSLMYDICLLKKGFLFNTREKLDYFIESNLNDEVKAIYSNSVKKLRLSDWYESLSPNEQIKNYHGKVKELLDKNEMEKGLSSKLKFLQFESDTLKYSWKNIRDTMVNS